jgi:hypothetical protein
MAAKKIESRLYVRKNKPISIGIKSEPGSLENFRTNFNKNYNYVKRKHQTSCR